MRLDYRPADLDDALDRRAFPEAVRQNPEMDPFLARRLAIDQFLYVQPELVCFRHDSFPLSIPCPAPNGRLQPSLLRKVRRQSCRLRRETLCTAPVETHHPVAVVEPRLAKRLGGRLVDVLPSNRVAEEPIIDF